MPKVSMLIVISFFFIVHGAFAAEGKQRLTLDSCIQKALRTHPDIKKFVLQIKHSKASTAIARADYLPQVSFDAEYDPAITYVMPANGAFQAQEGDGWRLRAALKQKIWDFSKTASLIKAQETQEEAADLSLQDAKALLAYKVKLQYELAFVQQKAVVVRQKDLETKEGLYKQAQALVGQGMKTQADATRFLSAVYAAKDNLSIAESNFIKAKTVLSMYISEPVPKDVKLDNSISSHCGYGKDEARMLQDSPVLQGLRKNINKNEFLYKAAKAAKLGSFDAVASYTHQRTLNIYDSTAVGIMYNIPLYSGGRLSAQEEQAVIDEQSAQNDYNAKVLAFKEEFELLRTDLKRYAHTIKAKSAQLQAARQTQRVVNGRYGEGLATYVEALDATTLVLDAKLGLLQANYDRSSTIHRLEYLNGKII